MSAKLTMNDCPVLRELAVTEDYDGEHEQAPVLSGGDYDIGAIRDCGEHCTAAALAYQRGLQIRELERALALIFRVGGTTVEGLACNGSWCAEQARQALRQNPEEAPNA